MSKTKLHPVESAPRDGTLFLGDFGWPWLLPAAYNPYDEKFVVAVLQACPMKNGKLDYYFENEYEAPGDLKGWAEITKK
jgi:hypothetical protein